MPTKITTLTVNELGQASASKAAAAAAEASAAAAAVSAEAALAAENSLLEWKGPWVTATAYAPSDLVEENGNTYVCVLTHTSGTFATDLGNSLWQLFAAKGDTGPGSGDLLAANNLSDVASIPTARANLGISTFGATLIDDVSAEAARTTLGLDIDIQEFNSGTGTWTPPSWIEATDWVTIYCVAGGGSGQHVSSGAADGGGGGGGAVLHCQWSQISGGTFNYSVGAGGASLGSPGTGNQGGNTWFGTSVADYIVRAVGGLGGGAAGWAQAQAFPAHTNTGGFGETDARGDGPSYLPLSVGFRGGDGGDGSSASSIIRCGIGSLLGGGGGGGTNGTTGHVGGSGAMNGDGGPSAVGIGIAFNEGHFPGGGGGAYSGASGNSGQGAGGTIVVIVRKDRRVPTF